jgi:hypothetical protein
VDFLRSLSSVHFIFPSTYSQLGYANFYEDLRIRGTAMNLELSPSVKYWSNFFHPVLMWALLLLSLYAAYLGQQVQRTRNAEGEQKKELVKGKYNVKHYQIGSVLLALMVTGAIGGMAVTYINNGKLFVGPHLLAGLGMTSLIAFSASLSPFMQKGANWARLTHILLNFALLGLFAWQALSGVEIVQRILTQA